MSLFSFASWIAEERRRARRQMKLLDEFPNPDYFRGYYEGHLASLRRLSARLKRGR